MPGACAATSPGTRPPAFPLDLALKSPTGYPAEVPRSASLLGSALHVA